MQFDFGVFQERLRACPICFSMLCGAAAAIIIPVKLRRSASDCDRIIHERHSEQFSHQARTGAPDGSQASRSSQASPDLVASAIEETSAQITRIGLTFIGMAAFCLLSLLSPDSALLGGSEKINVPLAGPVSFFGFMLLAPAVLVMLRVYLQIYVEHGNRLELLGQSIGTTRAPTLIQLKNPLMRIAAGLTFYLLLPLTMILFAWRAAVFPAWGTALLSVAAGVTASHAMLRLGGVPWRSNLSRSIIVAIIAAGTLFGLGPLCRPFNLYHANLSGHWLARDDLSRADISNADLSGAKLGGANLGHANLYEANLTGAYLFGANLHDANLKEANLSGALLNGAEFSDANLSFANLSGADLNYAQLPFANLSNANLSSASLHGANLRNANLTFGANLSGADLSGAILIDANLDKADLSSADLSGANLIGADLSGAKLAQAKNFTKACGDEYTKLPEGFTVKPCPY